MKIGGMGGATMAQAAIRPTVTQKVRALLTQQGVDLKPWSGLDETYVELYALLNRRKDDPAFWPPLARLLGDMVADMTDPESPRRLSASQAELLGSWDVKTLIADIRTALPGGDVKPDASAVRRFGQELSARMLGGFLLLGLAAAGCNEEGDDGRPDTGDADQATDTAEATDVAETPDADASDAADAGCELDPSSVLWQTIAASTLPDTDKASLCTCFASLNASWTTGLTTLFATGTPAQVAQALEDMLACICPAGSTFLGGDYADPHSLCTPIYKGVVFGRR